jgi:hypothetical protein
MLRQQNLREPAIFAAPGAPLAVHPTGHEVSLDTGRAPRRAMRGDDATLEERSERPARDSGTGIAHALVGEGPETRNETACGVYRSGGTPSRRARRG